MVAKFLVDLGIDNEGKMKLTSSVSGNGVEILTLLSYLYEKCPEIKELISDSLKLENDWQKIKKNEGF